MHLSLFKILRLLEVASVVWQTGCPQSASDAGACRVHFLKASGVSAPGFSS